MTTPDEIEMARYWAEISRLRRQLQRFTETGMRMYEAESPRGPLTDVTEEYVAGLKSQIEEQETLSRPGEGGTTPLSVATTNASCPA